MKLSRFFSGFFLVVAMGLIGVALVVVMAAPGTPPTLLSPADEAQEQVVQMMDALCQGDFSSAGQYILGNPSFGADREPDSATGAVIWDAFVDSLSYELSGECYATDTGVAQNVVFTYLDITSVTDSLAPRSEKHLTRLQEQATHTSEIYDENGNFHSELVMQVLETVVQEALQEDAQFTTCTFTLQLVKQDDRWYILSNNDLIHAISGGM